MSSDLGYLISGVIIGILLDVVLLSLWFLFASYRELGLLNMWLWPLFNFKKSYRMVKNRMYNQLQKVTFGSKFFQVIFGGFILLFVFLIGLAIGISLQINIFGL